MEACMVKALIVFLSFIVGCLLIVIAIFGMTGAWDKFLFFPLTGLQQSLEWSLGLIGAGFACWFFGGILLRKK
jgi:hypothetical protein